MCDDCRLDVGLYVWACVYMYMHIIELDCVDLCVLELFILWKVGVSGFMMCGELVCAELYYVQWRCVP